METYICDNVYIPLRSNPAHKAEMNSQILFGERYTIIDSTDNWLKINNLFDMSTGWTSAAHTNPVASAGNPTGFVLNQSIVCYKDDHTKMIIEAGSEIYTPDFQNHTFTLNNRLYRAEHSFTERVTGFSGSIADTALTFINAPYLWGGRTPSGVDCSGLVQLVCKIHGIMLPRNAAQQAKQGTVIPFIEESQPGDIAFFDDDEGNICHTGIMVSKGSIIHASGKVRIDPVDHQGIYRTDRGIYSHKLRMIKRLI